MRKIKSRVGYLVYEVTAQDTVKLGGQGICDTCGKPSPKGYLVAVLNSYLCPKCYEVWDARSLMYSEDMPLERKREAYFNSVLGPLAERPVFGQKSTPEVETNGKRLDGGKVACPKCNGEKFDFFAHMDGRDFYQDVYNCSNCGERVYIKRPRRNKASWG